MYYQTSSEENKYDSLLEVTWTTYLRSLMILLIMTVFYLMTF